MGARTRSFCVHNRGMRRVIGKWFELVRFLFFFCCCFKDDRYYGRGTTDCLGHVALITDLFVQLAEKRPALKTAVWAVFIAS